VGGRRLDTCARLIESVGAVVLDRVDLRPGLDLLDVGTGTGGNVAIPAARRGANVVGLDIAPELFEHARRRAAEAGVEVEWIEGDAQELPFEDESFDRVSRRSAPCSRRITRVRLPSWFASAAKAAAWR
jgi:ubiquinone/menaquinone biosynthesis C-methylase UbiE